MENNRRLIERVQLVYDWLDSEIRGNESFADNCKGCGECCDFDSFDHRLFITTPELKYLLDKLGVDKLEAMASGCCPYNINGKCTVYEYRFAGCRIFYCNADKEFQSWLSESALAKFKSICEDFQIPYRYMELSKSGLDEINF